MKKGLFGKSAEETGTDADLLSRRDGHSAAPKRERGLLIAHAPRSSAMTDRCAFKASLVVGRNPDVSFPVKEATLSREHFELCVDDAGICTVTDLGSRNGTFVNGKVVKGKVALEDQAVIRAGGCVFVYVDDPTAPLMLAKEDRRMIGRFYNATILAELRQAASSKKHLLVVGPTGVGKELAARNLVELCWVGVNDPIVVHNAALFGTEDQAMSLLFGVAAATYTGVAQGQGLLEQAHGDVLYLDEVHALPSRAQRALLRVIEDGQYTRIGESKPKQSTARMILATNREPPCYGLEPDFVSRLRVVRIPPLAERLADIPNLLETFLQRAFAAMELPSDTVPALSATACERLCLHGLKDRNVRGLLDIADRAAAAVADGDPRETALDDAIAAVIGEPLGQDDADEVTYLGDDATAAPATLFTKPRLLRYEDHRAVLEAALRTCKGNLTAAVRYLADHHQLGVSRKSLAKYAERWVVK